MSDPAAIYETIRDELSTVIVGNEPIVEQLTVSLLTGGHVLLEGVPGVAKTTIANAFARATGLGFVRVQMTPDLLPADITGTTIYRESTGEFERQRGPVFSNIVLADEINRATPKTQSALLEAMEEGTVTIDGETLALPSPFMVIATQNPIEMEGTFELPEAQRDRFQLKVTVSLPDRSEERELLNRIDERPGLGAADVDQVVNPNTLTILRERATGVHVAAPVKEYVLDLVAATRSAADLDHGASPRATMALLNTAKARAAIRGRSYAIPDDVKTLAPPVLEHRLVLSADAELSNLTTADVIADLLADVEPPRGVDAEPTESPDGQGESPADGQKKSSADGQESR